MQPHFKKEEASMNTGRKSIANWVGTFGTAALAAFGPTLASAQPQRYASAPTSQQPQNTATRAYPRSDCNLEARPNEHVVVRFEEGPQSNGLTDSLISQDNDSFFVTIVPHGDSKPIPDYEIKHLSDPKHTEVFYHGKLITDYNAIYKDISALKTRIHLCQGSGKLGEFLLTPVP